MLNLTLDFGNSRDKLAVFKDGELLHFQEPALRFDSSFLRQILDDFSPEQALLSCTGEERTELTSWLTQQVPLITLDHHTPLPFLNAYATPETLGRDRLALAAGLSGRVETGKPALAIDAGTCITLDLLDQEGVYRGGIIAPGIAMRLRAMHTFTARLPLVDWNGHAEDVPLVGDSTRNSLLAGSVTATAAELDGLLMRYQDQFPALQAWITGGDGLALAASMKNQIFAAPHLLMEGLNKILIYNVLERS
jgi:type III pantothenate kinase